MQFDREQHAIRPGVRLVLVVQFEGKYANSLPNASKLVLSDVPSYTSLLQPKLFHLYRASTYLHHKYEGLKPELVLVAHCRLQRLTCPARRTSCPLQI